MSTYLQYRQQRAPRLIIPEEKKEMKKSFPRQSKPLPKRSEKLKAIMTALKPIYKRFLKDRPFCEIRSPICTSEATVVHHTAGRGINDLLDEEKMKASCCACNLYVEENHEWARENGFKISRHAKNQH